MSPTVIYVNLRPYPAEHRPAVAAAHELGFDVVLVADKAPSSLDSLGLREFVQVNTRDEVAFDAAIDEVARRHDVVGITTWTDRDVVSVSRAAARLGLPGVPIAAAEISRNKYAMREVAGRRPQHSVVSRLAADEAGLRAAVHDVGFPAVIKPTSLSGSTGIFRVDDEAGAAAAYQRLAALTRPGTTPPVERTPHGIVVEQFVDGPEFSVEGLVSHRTASIVGVTAKQSTADFFLEVGHLHPAPVEEALAGRIAEFATWLVGEIGLDHCAFHLECRVAPDGTVKLIEIAARIGGGYITSHLVPLATGLPMYQDVLRVVTGTAPRLERAHKRVAGIAKIVAPHAGTFERVDGAEEAAALPGVRLVDVIRAPGARVALPPEDFVTSLLGSVIADGEDAHDVRDTLARASALLRPVIR